MDAKFLTSAFRESQYPPADRPEIAFAGRSNVGKSSLLNVLVNRKKLAKTSSRPGRTQAINFFSLGDSFYFVDLPGYGFARVPLNVKKTWRNMVETYLKKRLNLNAVVVIFDIRREPSNGDIELLTWLESYGIETIIALTKVDKLSRQKVNNRVKVIRQKLENIVKSEPVLFSAKTRQGQIELWEKINAVSKT